METIRVATGPHGKKIPVEGFRVGAGLAVTQAVSYQERSSLWQVIHRPTGRVIGNLYSTKAGAKRIAMTLLEVADVYDFIWGDLKTVKQYLALPRETIQAVKAVVGPPSGIELGGGVRKWQRR